MENYKQWGMTDNGKWQTMRIEANMVNDRQRDIAESGELQTIGQYKQYGIDNCNDKQ